ncbi:MAG: tRNA (adenosine(37)-N6)-dimethylallyltransferase MiaA [Lamprobacter sp.]|uniref:tRNA (adenosine(37)-N6)-dimethylallyltransferase MiaA n=1 Tax=Lamprobacter sp. TaxID=3100796 RepID=UPI002B262480|nr:tRNA (adenosine(37)-N6)-dimethylallyltransferase MiaA [Lamprobacter sp.]MEA3638591.1 tRNA (adenosine(37)-N6)-dimethylallyltransferase MiaA [Lamprobacter sp.]
MSLLDAAEGSARPPAILITGPTASGKTDLALAMAAQLPCELISVDSALVYRGMDIGTAKPAPSVLERFPHRLIDICDPSEVYSAARFREDALRAMAEITAAGRIPLLVGGTMLYWRALVAGLSPLPMAQPEVRAQLAERHAMEGAAAMHAWLTEVDPQTAARVHPNDPQRVQRALEVYLVSGRPMSELWHRDAGSALPYRLLKLVRSPRERIVLHQRIAARLQAMFAAGFEEEVRALYARGDLNANLPSMRSVGYRQLWAYLNGELSWERMREKALAATRQLAKRQYTWLRAEPDAVWLWDGTEIEQSALQQVEAFLNVVR